MSAEEIRYNRDILKTVSASKKAGELVDVFQKCSSKKISNAD